MTGLQAGSLTFYSEGKPPHGLMASAAGAAAQSAALPDDVFLVVHEAGITAYCGHVDLGTGIRTALAQIVAEELDVAFTDVTMVLGHTEVAPNQGATIASETIQVSAIPLRKSAAQARALLLALAAEHTGTPVSALDMRDGVILGWNRKPDEAALTYRMLVRGRRERIRLDETVVVKSPKTYRVVGKEVARVDIPDKATGRAVYVHDVRMPGMAHGRVIRPPYGGFDHGPFVGCSLRHVDRASIAHLKGVIDVVVIGDFVGVVAEREEQAIRAAETLKLEWETPDLPDLTNLEAALRSNPHTDRHLLERGNVDAALGDIDKRMDRVYLWPYQMHASIGPSCSVAAWSAEEDDPIRLRVWSGTQNPHMLRGDLGKLTGLQAEQIAIIRHEAAGCYGRNCADDVGGDAALLARAVGRPVRVQLTRQQEHVWEPKGSAQLMTVRGGLNADGSLAAYDFTTRYPSNISPILASVLTGVIPAKTGTVVQMGDRTCITPYDFPNARVVVHDMAPIARASWFRGVSAMPNSFAHESYIDELAAKARVDPVAYRLRYLKDERAKALLLAVTERAGWQPRIAPQSIDRSQRHLRGRGVGYAVYVHGTFPGIAAAWAAWVTDVEVDRKTGQIRILKVWVAQDAGMMVNPAGVRHQIHGNIVQSIGRALKEEVAFDAKGVASRDWGTYPLLTFDELPEIDVLMIDQPDQPPLGVGESASVPSAAAIANAVFDATGVRLRELPFTPARIRAAMEAVLGPWVEPQSAPAAAAASAMAARPVAEPARDAAPNLAKNPRPALKPLPQPLPMRAAQPDFAQLCGIQPAMARRSGWRRWLGIGALGASLFQAASTALPWRPPIAPINRPDPLSFATDLIERGRLVAAAGDCAVCHTAVGGAVNAGGLGLETPFGLIRTTNLTPDEETGIGNWSYAAFARAMRHGISRDGHHLYPAFPYTAFAKIDELDMQALYAFLMSQPPIRNRVPETKLNFPYNLRPAMAGWNLLFHDPAAFRQDPRRSAEWNRGAYLAEGLGHCSACHTPRNTLGAEQWKSRYFAGGEAEGWEAPPLGALSRAPVAWTEDALFSYLRTGYSEEHGPASGPMGPVVAELSLMPEADIRAISVYVASFGQQANAPEKIATLEREAMQKLAETRDDGMGARIWSGSCAACHEGQAAHMFGSRPSLATNSNLFAEKPDNLLNVILDGVSVPATPGMGTMPGFHGTLDDTQIVELLRYLRKSFAPGQPAWQDLAGTVQKFRVIRERPHDAAAD